MKAAHTVLIRQGLLLGSGKSEVWTPGREARWGPEIRRIRQDRGFSSARSGSLQAPEKGASFSNLLEIQIFEARKLKNSGPWGSNKMPERERREVLFGNRAQKGLLWEARHFFGPYGEIRKLVRK